MKNSFFAVGLVTVAFMLGGCDGSVGDTWGTADSSIWKKDASVESLTLVGHNSRRYSPPITASFSPSTTSVVSSGGDGLRQWDAQTGELLRAMEWKDAEKLTFSPDGALIAAGSGNSKRFRDDGYDGYVHPVGIWSAESGEQMLTLWGNEHDSSLAFSPDGTRLVSLGADDTANVWDVTNGEQLFRLQGHQDSLTYAAFSPDGELIVTTSADDTARLWDADTGDLLSTMRGNNIPRQSIFLHASFSPDSALIATASGGPPKVWDAQTGDLLHTLQGHYGSTESARFSPDGTRILTAGNGGTARVYDARSGESIHVLDGHSSNLHSATFSPDGSRIVTASWDETAVVWDAETGQLLQRLVGHSDQVLHAEFSGDGKRIVTASEDSTPRIWFIDQGKSEGSSN